MKRVAETADGLLLSQLLSSQLLSCCQWPSSKYR
jgi:hypothetical protein